MTLTLKYLLQEIKILIRKVTVMYIYILLYYCFVFVYQQISKLVFLNKFLRNVLTLFYVIVCDSAAMFEEIEAGK